MHSTCRALNLHLSRYAPRQWKAESAPHRSTNEPVTAVENVRRRRTLLWQTSVWSLAFLGASKRASGSGASDALRS